MCGLFFLHVFLCFSEFVCVYVCVLCMSVAFLCWCATVCVEDSGEVEALSVCVER